jgi:hypothetical protein
MSHSKAATSPGPCQVLGLPAQATHAVPNGMLPACMHASHSLAALLTSPACWLSVWSGSAAECCTCWGRWTFTRHDLLTRYCEDSSDRQDLCTSQERPETLVRPLVPTMAEAVLQHTARSLATQQCTAVLAAPVRWVLRPSTLSRPLQLAHRKRLEALSTCDWSHALQHQALGPAAWPAWLL